MTKTCVICGKEFEPDSNRQKTCSAECRQIRHLENMRNSDSHKVKNPATEFYKGKQCKHKNCKYKTNIGGMMICNYLSVAGHIRGCEAKECNKYEKRTSARKKNQICSGV